SGSKFYRLDIAPNSDVLAVEVTPGAIPINAVVALLGPDGQPVMGQAVAGGMGFSVSGAPGPDDLFVGRTPDGDPGTGYAGQLRVPQQLDLDQLVGQKMDLLGQVALSSQDAGSFGHVSGIEYFQLLNESDAPSTLTAQGNSAARVLLAHYQEDGPVLRLVDFQ